MTLLSTHQMHQMLWCPSRRTLFVRTSNHCLLFTESPVTTNIGRSRLANIDHLHLANADHLCLVATASLSINLSTFKFHRHLRFSRFLLSHLLGNIASCLLQELSFRLTC